MIDKLTLETHLEVILGFCEKDNKVKFGSPAHKEASKSFWDAVKELDDLSRREQILCYGVCPITSGRFVKFPVKGGYARYIILKVGSKVCKMAHIPWAEGYTIDGHEASTRKIEDILAFEDRLSNLFQDDFESNNLEA